MARIILSCGHEVFDFKHSYHTMTKGTDKYGERAIVYQTVCGCCEDMYRRAGDIFDFEEVAYQWVSKGQKTHID
jgi:hypothetical protein